jgi:divalent metal cation (Fe/Co/Zn/Cd) transporter
MVVEATVALVAGFASGSIALVAFGLDSCIELLAAVVVLWQLSGTTDLEREHRALRIISVTFFALAAYVAVDSTVTLVVRERPEHSVPGIVLAGAALVVMPLLSTGKRRIGERLGNRALVADAAETMFCAVLSAVVLGGVGLNAVFGWWWADPAAALGVAYFALREGREIWTDDHEHD